MTQQNSIGLQSRLREITPAKSLFIPAQVETFYLAEHFIKMN